MFLVGIVPGNGKKEAKNIHPYLEVLVDELLSLTNAKMYDSYRQSDFKLKSEILFYVLDYPGVRKVFNVHGAGSYKRCLWCDVKGNIIIISYQGSIERLRFLHSSKSFFPPPPPPRISVFLPRISYLMLYI